MESEPETSTHEENTTGLDVISMDEEAAVGGQRYLGFDMTQVSLFHGHPVELAVSVVLSVMGTIGNGLILAVLSAFNNNSVFLYLKGLAVSDLVFCMSLSLATCHMAVGSASKSYHYEWFFAFINFPTLLMAPTISSGITLLLCLTRFIVVKFPIKGRSYLTAYKAKMLMAAVVFMVALTRGVVIYVSMHIRSSRVLEEGVIWYQQFWNEWFFSEEGRMVWLIMAAIFEHGLTFILAGISMLMFVTLRQHQRKILAMRHEEDEGARSSAEEHKKERHLIQIVLSVVLLHVICTVPNSLVYLLHFSPSIQGPLVKLCKQLFALNYSANFWMYLLNHEWMRKEAKKMACKVWSRMRKEVETEPDSRGGALSLDTQTVSQGGNPNSTVVTFHQML